MPSAADSRLNVLRRIGITEDEAVALECIWDGPALHLIADERATYLAREGYAALDTLDAVWHELDGLVAHTYMQHTLTPHQGSSSTTARQRP